MRVRIMQCTAGWSLGRHREKESGHLSSATCLALSHCVPNETWLIQLCAQIFELPAQILSADRLGIFPDADAKSRLLMEQERDYWQKEDSQGRERARTFLLCALSIAPMWILLLIRFFLMAAASLKFTLQEGKVLGVSLHEK